MRGSDRAIIAVDAPHYGTPRGRFIVAHEVGHFLLHEGRALFETCATGDGPHRGRVYRAEAEANAFATELLLPRELVTPRLPEPISLEAVSELGSVFGTSLTATAIRVVALSDKPCAVACTRDGVIGCWSASSFGALLARRFRIGIRFDAEILSHHIAHERAERVVADAWTRDRSARGAVFRERSTRLGRTGDVLSIPTRVAGERP